MNVNEEAREFLAAQLSALDMSNFSDREIRGCVDQLWTGGWEGFVRDHTGRTTKSDEMTDLQKLSFVQYTTGVVIKLGLIDEIVDYKIDETDIVLVIDYFELAEYRNRLQATRHATKMLGWKLKNGAWTQLKTAIIWDEDFESFQIVGQYGRVTTQDLYNDRVWQVENCYRPGTGRFPMDGAAHDNPSIAKGIST